MSTPAEELKAGNEIKADAEPVEPLDLEHLLARLKEPVKTRPIRRMTQGELERHPEKARGDLLGVA